MRDKPPFQQVRHDLTRWQLAVGRTVAQFDNPPLLRGGQLVGGGRPDCCGALVILHSPVAIPATIGAQTDTRFSTGLVQTGTVLVRLLDQADDGLALRDRGHSSSLLSLSQSAFSFFRSTNKAAASASAFSLCRSSRRSCFISSLSPRVCWRMALSRSALR